MGGRGIVLSAAAALALAAAPATAVVLGGGPAASDCYVTFDGVTSGNGRTVECPDGAACDSDAAADGRCTFAVTVCVKQPAEGCAAEAVTVTRLKGATRYLPNRPALPASAPACGSPNPVVVQLKSDGRRPGKRTIRTVALTDGNPKKDADQFTLRCLPAVP